MVTVLLKSIVYWCRRNKKALLLSLFNVAVITLLSYILNNQVLFTGEDSSRFALIEMAKTKIHGSKPTSNDNVVFIDVAYDKTLIPVYGDDDVFPIGEIDITDRQKLLDFLDCLQRTNKYAYIFLDVRFENKHKVPEVDSQLFHKIASMRNIVVAHHSDMDGKNRVIRNKLALNDSKGNIFQSNFVRYKYRYDQQRSMALYAYHELTGKDIQKHWFWYSCEGKLCYNSLFIDFPIETTAEDTLKQCGSKKNRHGNHYYLGNDILEHFSSEDEIIRLTEGKYIVIGDMENDKHGTYIGEKPGSEITFRAFLALMSGKHIVSMWILLTMSAVYFIISMSQLMDMGRVPKRRKLPRWLLFLLSLFGYTVFLSILVIVLGLYGNIYISVLIPSLYFSIQKLIINYKTAEL